MTPRYVCAHALRMALSYRNRLFAVSTNRPRHIGALLPWKFHQGVPTL